MKVEFLESNVFGPELVVSAEEFYKAKNNENEFDSLRHATEAFSKLFDVDYYILRSEFDAVLQVLGKNGKVIFVIEEVAYSIRRICEIYVSNDNQLQRVFR